METYEKAVQDPVAGSLGRIWLEYARFAEDRSKLVTAQNTYLRALVGKGTTPAAVTDEQDTELLWGEFLEMMRKEKPSLTLESLKQAVEKEHTRKRAQADAVPSAQLKRARVEEEAQPQPPIPAATVSPAFTDPPPKTYVVTAEDVDNAKTTLIDMTSQMPPDISAAWMIRDGDAPATPPEFPLFSPTRPKLSDATGRDLVGDEMALAVIERLMEDSGTVLLETCRGLWLLTALKQKEATKAIENLDKTMVRHRMHLAIVLIAISCLCLLFRCPR